MDMSMRYTRVTGASAGLERRFDMYVATDIGHQTDERQRETKRVKRDEETDEGINNGKDEMIV